MKNVDVRDTRSFALIGHARRRQDVARPRRCCTPPARPRRSGASTTAPPSSTTSPEEKERKHTLTSHVFAFDWAGQHLTLVDTPGDANFQAEGQICLRALDGAVLVVSAADGVKVGTEAMWRAARARRAAGARVRERHGPRARRLRGRARERSAARGRAARGRLRSRSASGARASRA